MKILASTPTRIDLAGGTLDIYPLYVLEDGGITINAAIELRSYVQIEERKDKKISIKSLDLKEKVIGKNLESLKLNNKLDFLVRIVKFYKPKSGLNITTYNTAPAGSGLGASSSLLIALSGALNKLNRNKYSKKQIIDIGANLEAQAIGIPTGKQDYYAAMFGGVNAWWFGLDRNEREILIKNPKELSFLEERCILSFTGISHFSGTNNWNMLKRYIDKRGKTCEKMNRIKNTALKMREYFIKGDFYKLAESIAEEWENRKSLARGVSNKRIENLMEKAKSAGALASKICGAGGGGCMITMVDKDKKEEVLRVLKMAGAKILPLKFSRQGLKIKIER